MSGYVATAREDLGTRGPIEFISRNIHCTTVHTGALARRSPNTAIPAVRIHPLLCRPQYSAAKPRTAALEGHRSRGSSSARSGWVSPFWCCVPQCVHCATQRSTHSRLVLRCLLPSPEAKGGCVCAVLSVCSRCPAALGRPRPPVNSLCGASAVAPPHRAPINQCRERAANDEARRRTGTGPRTAERTDTHSAAGTANAHALTLALACAHRTVLRTQA